MNNIDATDDKFSTWLKDVMTWNKQNIYGTGEDDVQFKLLEQVLEKYEQFKAEQKQSAGCVWIKATQRLPDEKWKGKMRNKTAKGDWHYENNVPFIMVKGLLNNHVLEHEWLDEEIEA